MRLPVSWNEITIGQFQECYFLLKDRNIESWIRVISVLSGITEAEIENNIPTKKLKTYIYQLQFLLNPNLNTRIKKYIYLKGKVYKSVYLANELNAAQIKNLKTNQAIDIKTFLGKATDPEPLDNIVENCHKLLASIYLPLTWRGFRYCPEDHSKISEDFKSAKMGDVYGTLFFYSSVFHRLTEVTADFMKKNNQEVTELMTEVNEWSKTSEATGDGK